MGGEVRRLYEWVIQAGVLLLCLANTTVERRDIYYDASELRGPLLWAETEEDGSWPWSIPCGRRHFLVAAGLCASSVPV